MEKRQRVPSFSQRLLTLRKERNENQQEFAQFLGLSRATVGFYENGDRLPDAETLIVIAQKCAVTSDWILGLSEVRTFENVSTNKELGLSQESIETLQYLVKHADRSTYSEYLQGTRDAEVLKEALSIASCGSLDFVNFLIPLLESDCIGSDYSMLLRMRTHFNDPIRISPQEVQTLEKKGVFPLHFSSALMYIAHGLANHIESLLCCIIDRGHVDKKAYIRNNQKDTRRAFRAAKRMESQ